MTGQARGCQRKISSPQRPPTGVRVKDPPPPNGPLMDASVPRAGKWDQKGTGVHTHLHAYGGIYSRLFGFLSHVLELCGPEREN